MRPTVPSGARRMTHHRAFCSSSRIDWLSVRIGWALSPSLRAAIPATAAMKTIWSTFSSVNGVITSVGMMPVRKSIQLPVRSGSSPSFGVRPVPEPGLVTRPMMRPMATAISDVIMNQSRVRVASRAALLTLRRLVIDTRIAKKTSGATASFNSWTKIEPTLSSVVTSQETSWLRASQPSRTPRTRPATIWAQKGTLGIRAPGPEPVDGCSASGAADAEFADTDTLQWGRIGTYEDRRTVERWNGDGVAAPAPRAAPLHDAVSDFAATDRGHTAAEIGMQARHERDARGMTEAHCCLHVEHVNT
ncbi:protein of unknown function [Streptomyces sp. KY70]|nr:protein of unknown function [Streptomyces sp. KY70]